jgi:hypothetical protein
MSSPITMTVDKNIHQEIKKFKYLDCDIQVDPICKNVKEFLSSEFPLINEKFSSEEYQGGVVVISECDNNTNYPNSLNELISSKDFMIIKSMLKNSDISELKMEAEKKDMFVGNVGFGVCFNNFEQNIAIMRLLTNTGYYMGEIHNVMILDKISSSKDQKIKICIVENFKTKKLLSQIEISPKYYGSHVRFNGLEIRN